MARRHSSHNVGGELKRGGASSRARPRFGYASQPADWSPTQRWPGGPVWFFLAPGCFSTKTPAFERWISLDFLGFSRPKRDLSMGYARFSLENFSQRLLAVRSARSGARARRHAEGRDFSWGKLNRFSVFPQ